MEFPNPCSVLELSVSETCNFACPYCIFWRNNDKSTRMDRETGLYAVKSFLDHTDARQIARPLIYFGTGEPLLNWPLIQEICRYTRSRSRTAGLNLMTNGSLVTAEHIAFFQEHGMHVGLSLDGRRENQNRSRPFRGSSSESDSYDAVLRALEAGRKLGYTYHSLSATFSHPDFDPEDARHVLHLCKEYGIREFALDYDIDSLTEQSYPAVADKLIALYREACTQDVSVFGYWLIPYLNALEGGSSYCPNACGRSVCVSAGNQIKVCGYDPASFGEFQGFEQLAGNLPYRQYLDRHREAFVQCADCPIRDLCFGQCIFRDRSHPSWKINCQFLRYITKKLQGGEDYEAD